MLTREAFIRHLRNDLNHLHDPDYLRRSPLAALFGLANRFDTPARLHAILVEGIEALEPSSEEPEQSRAWRLYDALFYRYVQRFPQEEVARQLGVCTRHVRREQQAALEVLALHLWEKFDLDAMLSQTASTPEGKAQAQALSAELAWLQAAPPEVPADLDQILGEVRELMQLLAAQHSVELRVAVHGTLPPVPAYQVAVTQALLNLLSVAMQRAKGGAVVVSAWSLSAQVQVRVEVEPGTARAKVVPARSDDTASLAMARTLINTCGGEIELAPDGEPFRAIVRMPALGGLPVLVIDDNEDALELLQRYASGTRYRLVTTRDPEQALSLAEELAPCLIVLDVMMPQVDGWKVLARLKQSPRTGHIPVIVCTILAQEELAYAVGASGFLEKPVTRQAFLAALDRQYAPAGTAPR